MNIHIVPDQKFIDDHASAVERYTDITNNRYIVFDKPPFRYLRKSDIYEHLPLKSAELTSLVNGLGEADKLFLHFINMPIASWLEKVETHAEINWIYYGAEVYKYLADIGVVQLYKAETSRYINKYPYCQWYRNNLLYEFLIDTYRKNQSRLRKKYFQRLASKIDCFCYYNPIEFKFIRDSLEGGFAYKHFFYERTVKVSRLSEPKVRSGALRIMVGNAASPLANHLDLFRLIPRDLDTDIFVPLSYGKECYRKLLLMKGREQFGDRFHPMEQFMPFKEYTEILESMDAAVFGHHRNAAMSTIRAMVAKGVKIFMDERSNGYKFLRNSGLLVYHLDELTPANLTRCFTKEENQQNFRIIDNLFGIEASRKVYSELF